MKILVINSGSSSLKYQLFDMTQNHVLAKWLVDKIWLEWSILKHKNDKWEKKEIESKIANHTEGLKMVLNILIDSEIGVIKSFEEIDAVWHRVVHGWELFSVPTIITSEVKETLKKLIPLAPLHNPANIMWIESVEQILPWVTNVAVFDTGFHQSMDPSSYLYAIPYKYYEKHKIRRYGFHGISHEYVFKRSCEILWKNENNVKTITCHIGNGASITAIHNGKVLDTSMGMTPLEWLAMWTRCGDLDPAIIYFLEKNENLSCSEIDKILNKESGMLWVSGLSSDMRDIEDGAIAGNERESLAMEIYVRRIVKYIWAYVALLDGCDSIVFTAGTLENSAYIRKLIVDRLGRLWIKLAEENNNFRGEEREISTQDSKCKVLVIPTNEEYMIAKDTFELVKS